MKDPFYERSMEMGGELYGKTQQRNIQKQNF
jgi:hypothetical protein